MPITRSASTAKPVGAGLPAMRPSATPHQLHRHGATIRQAGSQVLWPITRSLSTATLWELACQRFGPGIRHLQTLTLRIAGKPAPTGDGVFPPSTHPKAAVFTVSAIPSSRQRCRIDAIHRQSSPGGFMSSRPMRTAIPSRLRQLPDTSAIFRVFQTSIEAHSPLIPISRPECSNA